MIELFIEGRQADLSEELSTLLTYQIDDVKSFGTRNTNFSKTIKLLGTPTNNLLFGFVFDGQVANSFNPSIQNIEFNYSPAKSSKCLIVVDCVPIFKGVIRILDITITDGLIEYNCSVFGELGGFMSAIGVKMLSDLDFSSYNQTWNWTNIAASWNTIAGSGIYYPFIEYGNCILNVTTPNVAGHDVDVRAFRPALYVKEYIDKMFSSSGYSYDCSFFNTSFFNSLIIPHNEDEIYQLTDEPLMRRKNATQTSAIVTLTTSSKISFQSSIYFQDFTVNGSFDEFTFTGANGISGTIHSHLTVKYAAQYAGVTVYLRAYKNGIYQGTLDSFSCVNTDQSYAIASTPTNQLTIGGTCQISIVAGDIITLKLETTTSYPFNYRVDIIAPTPVGFTDNSIEFITPQLVVVKQLWNTSLVINNCIPKNIKQADFFTSILKMFNLYVVEDNNQERLLHIKPYADFYTGASGDDWTSKIDRKSEMKITPMAELTARYYSFLYDTDSDYFNDFYKRKYGQGFGDYKLDTGYEFSKENQDTKVIFSSTPIIADNGGKYASVMCKSNGNAPFTTGSTQERMNTKIRILQAKKKNGTATYLVKNVTTAITSVGSPYAYGYAGHLNDPITPTKDLNFNAPKELFYALSNPYPLSNLFNDYWLNYIGQIANKDSRLLTVIALVEFNDISNIDFAKTIHIDGVNYRVNKIIDFDPNERKMTKVELLKIV